MQTRFDYSARGSAGLLTPPQKVRLALMVVATLFLMMMMVMLASGRLDGMMKLLAPAVDSDIDGEGESAGEFDEGPGEGPDDGFPEQPGVVGLPTPREVEDPGDDETWRTTENYRRYRESMARLMTLSDQELAAEVDPEVEVAPHVWRDPDAFKGKVIQLRGILVRREPKHDQPLDLPEGARVNWEVQIYNYATKHIYTLDLIGECPQELMLKPVAIDAIFFDVIDYRPKRNVIRRSCFFIGRDLKSLVVRNPSSLWILYFLGIPIVLVLVFAWFESRKLARFDRDHLHGRLRRNYDAAKKRRPDAASAGESASESATNRVDSSDPNSAAPESSGLASGESDSGGAA